MKRTLLTLLIALFYTLSYAQIKEGKKQYAKYTLQVKVVDLQRIISAILPASSKPDFFDDKTIKQNQLLSKIIDDQLIAFPSGTPENIVLTNLKQKISPYLVNNPASDKKGIVLLHHPINQDVFYKGSNDKLPANTLDGIKQTWGGLKTNFNDNESTYRTNLKKIKDSLAVGKNRAALELLSLNQALVDANKTLEPRIKAQEDLFEPEFQKLYLSVPRYIEDTSNVERVIIGGTGEDNYFLGNKEALIVLFGNSSRIKNTKVALANLDRQIDGEFKDFSFLAQTFVLGGGQDIGARDPFINDGTQTISITLLVPIDKIIRPPYEIRITSGKLKDTIIVHEKVHFRLKVGFGAGKADVSYFGLKNNQLVFNPDSARKGLIKTSLFALLSFYPFGQDIDHIDGHPLMIKDRISINGGLRLSKDPLETLFLGIGYDFQKNFGLFIGWAWYSSTLTNIQPFNTPSNVVGYLKDSGKREYQGQFFFGLTMAPAGIIDLLGLKKKSK